MKQINLQTKEIINSMKLFNDQNRQLHLSPQPAGFYWLPNSTENPTILAELLIHAIKFKIL